MGQQLIKGGWRNLNSAYFWQNVMVKRDKPTILVRVNPDLPPEKLMEIMAVWDEYPAGPDSVGQEVIIETDGELMLASLPMGFVYRNSNSLSGENRDKSWAKVDCLYCDVAEEDLWLPAMMSGVCVVHTVADLRHFVEKIPDGDWATSLARIENYEKAQNLIKNS